MRAYLITGNLAAGAIPLDGRQTPGDIADRLLAYADLDTGQAGRA
jgi:hypothetical protein